MEFKIHRNLGPKDRIIRSILAIYLLSMAVSMKAAVWAEVTLGILGVALLMESIIAY